MANVQKGELTVEIDGTVYTFAAGLNTLVALETLFRMKWQDIITEVNAGSITHFRGFLWAMTRRHHKELTLDQVGDLIDRVGLATINEKFAEVLRVMYPDADLLQALGIDPNPPLAQGVNGTGIGSTETVAASA